MRSVVSIFMFFLIRVMVLSQPCPDSLYLNRQAQVDSFQILYPNCTEIEGDVKIGEAGGSDITDLSGLSVLTTIGGNLQVSHNYILTSLIGLGGVTSIEGDLKIQYNTSLTNLTGLEGLTSIGGDLLIWYNGNLITLKGMEGLTSIGGNFGIHYGSELVCLTGLEGITSIGGDLIIANNDLNRGLTGLEGLTIINGKLEIRANYHLRSLSGLKGLTTIGGDLRIYRNYILISMTVLQELTSIGGDLYIRLNHNLPTLMGLDNINPTSITNLWIEENRSLSTCEVESVCAYLASPNGEIEIHDNAIGCNSPEEVQDSCEANAVAVAERYILDECYVLPNPFTTSTTLSYTLDKPSTVTIKIFNAQSQLIEKIEQEQSKGEQQVQWNAEGLPAGMYYFRVQAGDKVGGGKMVKIK